jgi:hypothetical protein
LVVECLAKGIERMAEGSFAATVVNVHRSTLTTLIGEPSTVISHWPLRSEILLSFVFHAAELLRLQLLVLGPDHLDVARTRQEISTGISHLLSNDTDVRAMVLYAALSAAKEERKKEPIASGSSDSHNEETLEDDWMWQKACRNGVRAASMYEYRQQQENKRIQALYKS